MTMSAGNSPLLKVREMTVLALFAALMIALQVAMASLPNIKPLMPANTVHSTRLDSFRRGRTISTSRGHT